MDKGNGQSRGMTALPRIASALYAILAVGGMGLVLYLIESYRKRAHVRIVIVDEGFYAVSSAPSVTFEVENIGLTDSSLVPVVSMRGLLPRPRDRHWAYENLAQSHTVKFQIEAANRRLTPHSPVRFTAVSNNLSSGLAAKIGFLWFKTYTFRFTRGLKRKVKVRIRSADRVALPLWRFLYERERFRFCGRVTTSPELHKEVTDALSRN